MALHSELTKSQKSRSFSRTTELVVNVTPCTYFVLVAFKTASSARKVFSSSICGQNYHSQVRCYAHLRKLLALLGHSLQFLMLHQGLHTFLNRCRLLLVYQE